MYYKKVISKMADAVGWWTDRLNDKCEMDRLGASVFLIGEGELGILASQ